MRGATLADLVGFVFGWVLLGMVGSVMGGSDGPVPAALAIGAYAGGEREIETETEPGEQEDPEPEQERDDNDWAGRWAADARGVGPCPGAISVCDARRLGDASGSRSQVFRPPILPG